MFINDFLTIFLVPSLINSNNGSNFGEWDLSNNNKTLEEPPPVIDFTLSGSTQDPILAAINEEIKELHLDFPDDYFDHMEGRSEEIRHLIRTRKDANSFNKLQASTAKETEETTKYPILNPEDQETATEGTGTEYSSTTKKPKPNVIQSGIAEFGNVVGKLSSPITGFGKSLFGFGGKKSTPSSTKPTTVYSAATSTTTTAAPEQLNLCSNPHQIFFQGECRNLLQNQFCPSTSQWLVEDDTTLEGKCVENPCHGKTNTASFGGKCITVGREMECQAGMKTIIYRSGQVECDCKDGWLFNKENGRCYEAFKRGPCGLGQYFIIPKQNLNSGTKEPTCLPNPCATDGYFCNAPKCPKKKNCEQLGGACGNEGHYVVDPATLTPFCQLPNTDAEPILGNVPTLNCAPGSRRDILGNCRTPTTIDFS